MTDREMLEFAAKAAGVKGSWHRKGFVVYSDWSRGVFDPLNDDGDALRLVGDVGLVVCVMRNAGFTGIYLPADRIGGKYDEVQTHGADHLAATRRAITRAAAEIGKRMP